MLYRLKAGRAEYLTLTSRRHGDVGLPKGHRDPGDADDLATALRETAEETGIGPESLAVQADFSRTTHYPVEGRRKEVVYLLARHTEPDAGIDLSEEHREARWLDLDATLAALRHDNLRYVVRAAATYLKDPILRRGLDPAGARALLESKLGENAPVVAHAAQVAGMARALAEAWRGLDETYVEAAAWLHDIGRAVSHDSRHATEGFALLVAEGHPGYAPPCVSHFLKGQRPEDLGFRATLARALRECCDLESFPVVERLVALADAMAAGPRRVPIDERFDDLDRRYGESEFLTRNRAASHRLKAEFETHTGLDLYALVLA